MARKTPKKKAGDPEAEKKPKASPKAAPKASAAEPETDAGSNGDGDGAAQPKPKKKSSKKGPKGKPVVIVESPAKAKTINKILGTGYVVKACMGHVRDLPERKFGINVENSFEPTYQTIKGKTKIVSELRSATRGAEAVYLAPDPD